MESIKFPQRDSTHRSDSTITPRLLMKLTSLVRRRLPSTQLPAGRPPRLLVVQIAGIGDLVLAMPALDALRDHFPGAQIDLLTSSRADDLLAGHPSVDHIHPFDIDMFGNLTTLLSPTRSLILIRQIRRLRDVQYDALLSLNRAFTDRGGLTLGLLLRSLGVPLWLGRNTDDRVPYFDREVSEFINDPRPEAITKLEVAALIGAPPEPRPLSLPLGTAEKERAAQLLAGPDRWAAIMPTANVPVKTWPAERFVEVAKRLTDCGFRIAILAGPGDRETTQSIAQEIGERLLDLAGMLSLRETAAVLQSVEVAVTNDTGPMHIAAAVRTPLVAIFGPTSSLRYGPWCPEEERVILHDIMPCNPCAFHQCPMDA